MTLVKNFQKDDVAEALAYLLHMIEVLTDGGKPDREDMAMVLELIAQIRDSR